MFNLENTPVIRREALGLVEIKTHLQNPTGAAAAAVKMKTKK